MNLITQSENRSVRLVQGTTSKVVPLAEALNIAQAEGLDLVEVSPDVCKIMDWGKAQYEKNKRDKEAARKQKENEYKNQTVRLGQSARIGDADLKHKTQKVLEFLKDRSVVTVEQPCSGRERPEQGLENLKKVLNQIPPSLYVVEKNPSLSGKTAVMVLKSA